MGQYGFVTTADALEVGVPAVELPKLAEHGAFSHVAYGLYRFDDMPTSPRDMFAEAVLRVGRGAHLTRDAVLAFHGLALVNPSRVRVGSPRRVRVHLPAWVDVVTENMAADDLTVYDGVPSATVARALVDCRGEVMTERLIDAVAEARGQGLLAAAEADHVLADLRGAQ